MSRDALENLKKLPRYCYGVLDGQVVQIARGASRTVAVSIPPSLVDTRNAELGISTLQRAAMEAGVTFGWDADAADPDYHAEQRGENPIQVHGWTIAFPLVAVCDVTAASQERALELAQAWLEDLNLPDRVGLDGDPDIIDCRSLHGFEDMREHHHPELWP